MLKKKLHIFKKDGSKDDSRSIAESVGSGDDQTMRRSPSSPSRSSSSSSSAFKPSLNGISIKLKGSPHANLSSGLESTKFGIDELQTYGFAGKVKTVAFDPLQSLMAVVTDLHHIHIFGQSRVANMIKLNTLNTIRALRFVKGVYLLAFDSAKTIYVISLHTKKVLHTITTVHTITAFETDYSLEFVYVGFGTGTVKAYNLETAAETILTLREQQHDAFILESSAPVNCIKMNPRDIGTLLISYSKLTIVFSLVENRVVHQLAYKLPQGAPGGENATYRYDTAGFYVPGVVASLWHPNGLHVATVHDDNSIVFWDALTGELILARTPFDSYVDSPVPEPLKPSSQRMSRIRKAAWLCEADPEKTALLLLGGDSYEHEGYHQLVRMDFGKMLSYSLTSYTQMAKYYAQPRQQSIFAIHSPANILEFVALGEASPYFDGNHDPKLIALVLSDGSLKFLNYPVGNLSYNASYFPSTISWINPKITYSSSSFIDKRVLNGIIGVDKEHTSILKGGIPGRPKYKADVGSVIISGHESGYIRLWNASEGELDSSTVFEIDIARILMDDSPEYSVSKVSFAADQLELACSLYNSYVLLFSYQQNAKFQPKEGDLTRRLSSLEMSSTRADRQVIDISDRAPRDLRKGFLPKVLIKSMGYGKVTALCNSNVGFVAIGYESGQLVVLDRRSNGIIYSGTLQDPGLSLPIVPTAVEFAFGSTGPAAGSRNSLLMYVGTSIGRLITFEFIAEAKARYSVRFLEEVDSNDAAIHDIIPIDATSGRPVVPTVKHLKQGATGPQLSVITASNCDIRVVRGSSKTAHKTYGRGDVSKVGITGSKTSSGRVAFCVVVVLGGSKKVVALTIPVLAELANVRIPYRVEPDYASASSVLPLGDVFLRVNETEAALVNIMKLRNPVLALDTLHGDDNLFLRNIVIPYRPTVNQFIKGSASLPYAKLYQLLVGRERPAKSKAPEYELAWDVSPYNPANYSLMGTTKPKYYDPRALHQHPGLTERPVAPINVSAVSKNFTRWSQSAQHRLDLSSTKMETYVNDMNDDFDDFIKETKSEAIKGVLGGKLGL